MSTAAADVITRLNTFLSGAGYAAIGAARPNPDAFKDLLGHSAGDGQPSPVASPARQEFLSHPFLGKDADGLPVVGPTGEECTETVEALTRQAVARGQDPEQLHFILGKLPVSDGLAGPLLGFRMCPLVELTGMTPVTDQG